MRLPSFLPVGTGFLLSTLLAASLGCSSSTDGSVADTGAEDAKTTVDAGRSSTPDTSSETSPIADGGVGDGNADASYADATPADSGPTGATVLPARPSATTTGGATKWFAVSTLRYGSVDKSGKASLNAWKEYGVDLDGRNTSAVDSSASNGTCKRRTGSSSKVLTDGPGGLDNNFGAHVTPLLKAFVVDLETASGAGIASGKYTLLLRLDNVGPADNANVPGALYLAASLGAAPTFTETDVWPIDASSMAGDLPKTRFGKGYMAGGVWVSGDLGADAGEVPLAGYLGTTPRLALESLVISFDVKTGGNGTIAGAVKVSDLTSGLQPAFRSFGICPGSATTDAIIQSLTQDVDLVSGAPQLQDTARECDAVSVGLGFAAKPTGAPAKTVTVAPPPDGC